MRGTDDRWTLLRWLLTWLFIPVAIVAASTAAKAQGLNSQPFSFGNTGSGLGISTAGKQAIFAEKLFGLRPEHMIRSPSGPLLFIGRGPSGIAIAYDWSGQPIFSGRRIWNSGSSSMFNQQSLFFVDPSLGDTSTSATVSAWTAMTDASGDMMFANYLLPYDLNTIDIWTWEVYALSEY